MKRLFENNTPIGIRNRSKEEVFRQLGNKIYLEDPNSLFQPSAGIIEWFHVNYPDDYFMLREHWAISNEKLIDDYDFFAKNGRTRTKSERTAMNNANKMIYPPLVVKDDFTPTAGQTIKVVYDEWMINNCSNTPITIDPYPIKGLNWAYKDWSYEASLEKTKAGEDNMYFHFDTRQPFEQQQIEFAFTYAKDAYNATVRTLREKHNMNGRPHPSTAKELVEFITTGKYKLATDDELKNMADYVEMYSYDGDFRLNAPGITWGDPSWKRDDEGYEKALETLEKEYTKVKTVIMAGDYTASIKAVDDFSAKYAN